MVDGFGISKIDPTEHSARIQWALDRVLNSEMFVKADRLRSFLTYVVEETIAGRAKGILGKTIAQDVYLGNLSNGKNRRNLVRVDAGRLRRKLMEYYGTVGADDHTRIHIDSGSYVPWFENRLRQAVALEPEQPGYAVRRKSWTIVGTAAAVSLASLFFFMFMHTPDPMESVSVPSARELQRKALATKSPAWVQASNYCDQARGLLFPLARIDNQKLASAIFQQARKLAPDYVCSYAGLGHSLATSALLTPPGEPREELVQQAVAMAQTAVDLAPTDGWTQSAIAWAADKDLHSFQRSR